MSESKAELCRYWLVFFVKDMPVGQTFKPGVAHLTVLPWFITEVKDKEVLKAFASHFSGTKPQLITVGEKVMFGPKKDVPVNSVEEQSELIALHHQALEWFDDIGGRWAVQNSYVGTSYIAHIRRRQGSRLKPGQQIVFKNLYLVKAKRREDNVRTVAAKVELK